MTLPQTFIGVDVSKDWIDVFHLQSQTREHIANTAPALARFARRARGALVVFEPTGPYGRPLRDALVRAGTAFACVNPRHARAFAEASGKLAKTDRVDAEVLAQMGRALDLAPTPPPDATRQRLADLVARRSDLVGAITREKNRKSAACDAWITREIAALIKVLQAHLARIDAAIRQLTTADASLAAQRLRLQSVPGIGPAVSAVLLARLPELGTRNPRAIATLAGLAPQADDTGKRRGQRHIRGGRADVRRALYLAALVASRFDPSIKAFRDRLQAKGKRTKVAIIACARKLLAILNAMIKNGTDYRPRAA